MTNSSPEVEGLLRTAPARLPLTQSAFTAHPDACRLPLQCASDLFPEARHAPASLVGLLLRLGCWAESHAVAQDINSTEGNYWHGILHRVEPDSFNAAYWFRRTGKHAIFPELVSAAADVLRQTGPKHWRVKTVWDPLLFIEWCDEAREKGGQAEAATVEIQMAEWRLLFDWCAASA